MVRVEKSHDAGLIATILLLGAAVLSLSSTLHADVPRLIHYQGKLRSAAGGAVNASVNLRFRLYPGDTILTPILFDETHASVVVSNGLFRVFIGSEMGGVPDSALDAPAVWLGVSIDGGVELSPRTRIGSNPYAVKSRSAEQLVRPGTVNPAVAVDAAGHVGIGTATPDASALLDLSSTSAGFMPPRLSQSQRDAISAPSSGLMIFNTDSQCLEFYVNGLWQPVSCGCTAAPPAPALVTGNTTVCDGQVGVTYATPAVFGATSYAWSAPTGASISAGQGSTSIALTFGSQSGDVCVTASNACGTSAETCAAVTVNPLPGPPGTPTVTNLGVNTLTVNWTAGANATGYRLDVSPAADFSSFASACGGSPCNAFDVGNVLSYNLTGLTNGTTYYFRVRAVNDCGVSADSGTGSATTNLGIQRDFSSYAIAPSPSNTTLTFAHTVSGDNRILFVVASGGYVMGDNVSGITYNGAAMTRLNSVGFGTPSWRMYLYYLIAPATGTHDVVVSINTPPSTNYCGCGPIYAAAVSYTGVKQTGVPDAMNTDSHSCGPPNQSTFTGTLTTMADSSMVLFAVGGETDVQTAGTNATKVSDDAFPWAIFESSPLQVSPPGNFMMSSFTGSATCNWGWIMASFAPAP